ncbi:Imm50 family immunity protein [Xenorhabdus griffiniae]|uniref:Imm50 family immunity protein n=1 Tax=Xenorhabdus griffiniae TaxID=351672 RepID=UPI0030CACB69
MWFKNAIRNEQIKYMFNNEFDISEVEFISYTFHRHSSLQLCFICKKIPSVYPEKWNKKGFNAMSLVLSMSNINSFESKGNKVNFICSPQISSTDSSTSIEIINEDFYLLCNADFLTIDGITPYIDERWD